MLSLNGLERAANFRPNTLAQKLKRKTELTVTQAEGLDKLFEDRLQPAFVAVKAGGLTNRIRLTMEVAEGGPVFIGSGNTQAQAFAELEKAVIVYTGEIPDEYCGLYEIPEWLFDMDIDQSIEPFSFCDMGEPESNFTVKYEEFQPAEAV